MGKKIKFHEPDFKFKVALESFIQDSVSAVARNYGVNANQLSAWRKQFSDRGAIIFQSEKTNREKVLEKKLSALEQLIGKKEIEIAL